MSLECLAILGSKNDPLYLCTPPPMVTTTPSSTSVDGTETKGPHDSINETKTTTSSTATTTNKVDAFGFLDPANDGHDSPLTTKIPIRLEFMMHSALDRIEELLGSPKQLNLSRLQRGTNWLGSLCPIEDCEIYAYVIPSQVKFLALIKRESLIPSSKRKETDIKELFADIHTSYIKHVMNPFSKIRTKIVPPCGQFEQGVYDAIQKYQNTLIDTVEE